MQSQEPQQSQEKSSPNRLVVLGIDPGFASAGFARVELTEPLLVLQLGVVRTKASDKKRVVKAADDNIRRAREIVQEIDQHIGSDVVAICIESPSLPRNASTSFKLGLVYGLISALAETYGLPIVQVSPQELKKKVCGNSSASKEEIAVSLDARFGRSFAPELVQHGFPAGVHEHAYDALGAVVASMDSEVLRLVRRMGR